MDYLRSFAILPNISTANPVYAIPLALVIVYCICVATYRLVFSPLRSIPGPWYAAVSDLWHLSHVLRLRRCRGIDELFKKYGPIVRVAPNMVAFLDVNAMKVVYGTNARLNKSSLYKSLMTDGHDHAFTTLDHSKHAIRKKAYAAHYTLSHIAKFQPELNDLAVDLVSALESTASSATDVPAVDTLELLRHVLVDMNYAHIFSHSPGMIAAWEEKFIHGGASSRLSDAISDFPKRGLIKSTLPSWMWNLAKKIPMARWQKLCDSDAYIAEIVKSRMAKRREELRSGKASLDGCDKSSLLSRLLRHRYPTGEAMPDEHIVSECTAHIIAGSDTTSTTISFILWEISRRRDIAVRLQSELDVFMPDAQKIPDMQVLQNLPYLNALVKEGLRVYNAAPTPLERIAHGSSGKNFDLMGHAIPNGTIIGSQTWSTHRISEIFPCPDVFLPDRWLLSSLPIVHMPSQRSFSLPAAPHTPTKSSASIIVSSFLKPNHDISASVPPSPINSVFSSSSSPLSAVEKGLKGSNVLTVQSQMQAHFFPFGTGSRQCGGQNMAQIAIRVILAAIIRNFDVVAAPETTEESMEICDSFVIFPKAMQCKLLFIPREH